MKRGASSSTRGVGAGRQSGRRLSARAGWFLAALAVFILSTLIAFTQAPRPDVYRSPSFTDWLRYPIERNAFLHLPVIPAELNDVFALPGADRLWVAGDRGFVAYSDDGGRTWTQDTSLVRRFRIARQEAEQAGEESTVVQPEEDAVQQQAQEDRRAASKGALIQQPMQQQVSAGAYEASEPADGTREAPGPVVPDLHAVFFADAQHGWVVGTGGTILTSDDGGQNWQLQEVPDEFYASTLRSVYFTDARTGWAVGRAWARSVILYTADEGRGLASRSELASR